MATDYHIADVFLALRNQCQWLNASYMTFCALYASGEERRTLLHDTAPAFFFEHNLMLQQHFILHACKLTDRPKTMGNSNLTFSTVNLMLREQGLMTVEIERVSEKLEQYRGLVLTARHHVLSHFDLETTMAGEPVGAHEKEDLTDFLESVYQYTDAVGIVLGIGPLDYRGTAGPGDANDLVKHLKNSLNHQDG